MLPYTHPLTSSRPACPVLPSVPTMAPASSNPSFQIRPAQAARSRSTLRDVQMPTLPSRSQASVVSPPPSPAPSLSLMDRVAPRLSLPRLPAQGADPSPPEALGQDPALAANVVAADAATDAVADAAAKQAADWLATKGSGGVGAGTIEADRSGLEPEAETDGVPIATVATGEQTVQSGSAQPGSTQPGSTQPGSYSAIGNPAIGNPGSNAPSSSGLTQPGLTQPGLTQPGPTQPSPTQPGPTQPSPTQPGPTQASPAKPGTAAPSAPSPAPSSPAPPAMTNPQPSSRSTSGAAAPYPHRDRTGAASSYATITVQPFTVTTDSLKEPSLPKVKTPGFTQHRHSSNPCFAMSLLQDIATVVNQWQLELEEVHNQIQAIYMEGPIVDGWLEADTGADGSVQGYRLCGLNQHGQLWSRPCPPDQLPGLSVAIARYQTLRQTMAQKHRLEVRLKQLGETLAVLRSRL